MAVNLFHAKLMEEGLEYLSQSNNSADCVSESDRFKFIDYLSVLEIVNLLTVGITSFNLKQQVPSDIPAHNQYIPAEHSESQRWLNTINDWTLNVNQWKENQDNDI